MNVLIIIPNANVNSNLDLGKESREIENGLLTSPFRNKFSISTIYSARPQDIRRRILRNKPEYIHICGHSVKDEGVIIQDNNDNKNNIQFLNGVILKEFFGIFSDEIHCVLLNSCYSSETAKSISSEIDFAIGMKHKIQDEDAIEFAVSFYDGIFSGESIENSFRLACNSLKWLSTTRYPEPVLYKKGNLYKNSKLQKISNTKSMLISPSRLPSGNTYFCGRENEMKMLHDCWNNNVNIICIEAWGGCGKTALVAKWRSEMINSREKEAEIIFDWSFHSQGNINNRPVSADLFFDEALKWFGDKSEDRITEKGEKLALLVRERKAIIILDGMESLQYSDNFVGKEGEIKDYSLKVFVSMLSDYNHGLCVITTRKKVPNLNYYNNTTKLLELQNLNIKQSRKLLKNYNVYGNNKTIKLICKKNMGHALSLNLIATYIRDNLKGNADNFIKRGLLGTGSNEEKKLIKVMQSYEDWYGEGKHIRILRILSLFDRPAKQEELSFLLTQPMIVGLTDGIINIGIYELGNIFRQLKHASLIMEYEIDNINYFDTHPLIREYFGKRVLEQFPESYRKGHYCLYKYFSISGSKCPAEANQMNFWFRAVYHGCLAEKYEEVFESIYIPHIKQGEKIYDARVLGGHSTDIDAISSFFAEPWTILKDKLDEQKEAAIYAEASFALRSNGLISESIIPLIKAFNIEKTRLNYEEAAMAAGNLSELYLVIGEMDKAVKYANKGIEIAEKSNKVWRHYWIQLAKKADIFSKIGKYDFANAYFRQAEYVQKNYDVESERLYGVLAFKKFDAYLTLIETEIYVPYRIKKTLLIDNERRTRFYKHLGEYEKEVEVALKHDIKYKRILHIALDKLIMMRINILKSILQYNSLNNIFEKELDEIINCLYESGRAEYIPYGLLTRSLYWNLLDNDVIMRQDIIKTQYIIRNKNFKLFEVDVLVEETYLNLLVGNKKVAERIIKSAKDQCVNVKYFRKIKEINLLIETI